eukprot:CAMPEP_0204617628 /NCGR_PEP_ID=MMETSP0717-20131115/4542_1 /ASSEMBLY_ACC=CAM_ASM_000666 /TAXON_ID=230516 /ORGANISM="Chaetoceros curvisetus" /LENGTH=574 /DNA_ID=CAMNT_0051631201 /DNA_START=30 /DNA_END=1757 /DNA_ORIENTATION=+
MSKSNKCQKDYDYIVVGAGSAGCAFAGRLISLLPSVRIALIEPGKDYLSPNKEHMARNDPKGHFRSPEYYPSLWAGAANRGYRTVPQGALNDRQLSVARASGVGGCSVINAMIWKRGFREDWDGNMPPTFQGNAVEPEFDWLEERIQPRIYQANNMGECGMKAAHSLGYDKAKDDSFWSSPGTYNKMRCSITKEGQRQDMYRALGANDDKIHLVQGDAERIIFEFDDTQTKEGKGTPTAKGVMIRRSDGSVESLYTIDRGDRVGEVIVCCGAIDTPKLLQLSGVGPAKLLEGLDIPVIVDNPSVGEGLKDHVMHVMSYEASTLPDKPSPITFNSSLYDEALDIEFLFSDGNCMPSFACYGIMEQYNEKVPPTNLIGKIGDFFSCLGSMALVKTLSTLMDTIPSIRTNIQKSTGIAMCLMNPKSVGSVMVRSKNPSDMPLIDPGYLTEEADLNTMLKGLGIAKKLMECESLSNIVGKRLAPPPRPGNDDKSDDDMEEIRQFGGPYFHPTGTCSIGECLDDQLRFKGINRLRVADASSLPFIPRMNTNPSSMVVGARCASLIANGGCLVKKTYSKA